MNAVYLTSVVADRPWSVGDGEHVITVGDISRETWQNVVRLGGQARFQFFLFFWNI